jgi:hypothetical protein
MSQQDTAWSTPFSVIAPPAITTPVNASLANPGSVAVPVTTPEVRPEPPKGYYYNNRGKLRKKNLPMK